MCMYVSENSMRARGGGSDFNFQGKVPLREVTGDSNLLFWG